MASFKRAGIITAIIAAVLGGGIFGGVKYYQSHSPRTVIKTDGGGQIHIEELSFFSGGDKIYGRIYKPQDTLGKKPVLIYSHGLGQTGDEAEGICKLAAAKGYVAYHFDFRGGGPHSRSDGKMTKMSLITEKQDLNLVIKRLSKEDIVDSDRIYLIGHSLGGAVSASYAADHPKRIAGLVLLAPALNMPDVARAYYPVAEKIPSSFELLGWTLGGRFYSDIHDMDAITPLRRFKGDVLIIHGDADDIVPLEYSRKAEASFPNCELKIYENVPHAFLGDAGVRMKNDLGVYLTEHNPM